MMFNYGDIVLIPLPFTDLTATKKRPVLIVSNNDYNKKTMDIVVVAITSNMSQDKEYTVMLKTDSLQSGELKQDSCIRTDKIYTLSKSIVQKNFGRVKDEIMNEVMSNIFELFSDDKKQNNQ
jgi:mRNA interferase MazF